MKSKGCMIAGVIVAAIAVGIIGLVLWGTGVYNSLVTLDEGVRTSWGQVQTQYQRRADLIPNLVSTVKGYAAHEREVLMGVTEARAKVGQITVTPEVLNNPQAFQRFQAAQDGLSSALSRLLAVVENYPQLKANENFLVLQDQLEGTENRISVARQRFNTAVQGYNTTIRRFPASIVAGMTGFEQKQYFQAAEGADTAPAVEF
ncbi:MAG: LemA family protein [Bacteroidota bacterium]